MDLVILVLDMLAHVRFRFVVAGHAHHGALRMFQDLFKGRVQHAEVRHAGHLLQHGMESQLRSVGPFYHILCHGGHHEGRPGHALGGGAPGASEGLSHDAGQQIRIREPEVPLCHPGQDLHQEGNAVAGACRFLAGFVQPPGKLRHGAAFLGDVQKHFRDLPALPDGLLDDGRPQSAHRFREVHLEGVEFITFEMALGGQDVVGVLAVLRPGDVRHHQKIQIVKGLAHHIAVRIGAHGRTQHADGRADPVLAVGEHLHRHDAGWEGLKHREVSGLRAAPDLGIVLVDGLAAGGPRFVNDGGSWHQCHAADDFQHQAQIGVQRAVAAAEQAQILMDAPSLRGEDLRQLLHLFHGNAGHPEAFLRLDQTEPAAHFIHVRHVLVDVFRVLPVILKDEGDEALHHQRIGTGTVGDMQIRHAGGFRHAGIDDDEHLIGILGVLPDVFPGIAHLMGHVGVGPPEHHDLAARVVRFRKADLIAEDLSVAPPVAHELKSDGIEQVLAAQGAHEEAQEYQLALAAAGGTADAAYGTGTVLVHDVLQLRADLIDGLIPGDPLKMISHFFHGVVQAVLMIKEIFAVSSLAAGIAVGAGAVLVRTHRDHLGPFHFHFQAAADAAESALGLFPYSHRSSFPGSKALSFFHDLPNETPVLPGVLLHFNQSVGIIPTAHFKVNVSSFTFRVYCEKSGNVA